MLKTCKTVEHHTLTGFSKNETLAWMQVRSCTADHVMVVALKDIWNPSSASARYAYAQGSIQNTNWFSAQI